MLKELRLKIEYFEIPTQTTTLSRAATCSDEPHQAALACRYGGPEPTFYAFSRISQRLAVCERRSPKSLREREECRRDGFATGYVCESCVVLYSGARRVTRRVEEELENWKKTETARRSFLSYPFSESALRRCQADDSKEISERLEAPHASRTRRRSSVQRGASTWLRAFAFPLCPSSTSVRLVWCLAGEKKRREKNEKSSSRAVVRSASHVCVRRRDYSDETRKFSFFLACSLLPDARIRRKIARKKCHRREASRVRGGGR
jgi:hypothetical protein